MGHSLRFYALSGVSTKSGEDHPAQPATTEELMIEVMNSVGSILSFDGRVIEEFSNLGSGSSRVHIHQVEGIEVKERRKGLEIFWKTRYKPFTLTGLDPSARAAVDQFVAQVKAARGLP
jgi:hypothetical protein